MPKRLELAGKKFGRLEVLKLAGRTEGKKKEITWLCKCDCGNEKEVVGWRLTSGKTQSCGCLNKEITIEKSTKHGMSHDPLYFVWKAMIDRCTNTKNSKYKDYGGRGIDVCNEWLELEVFLEWSKMNGYKKGLELDRINNDGDYKPSNCRWASRKTQTRNKRTNVRVTIEGVTKTLAEWAEEYGYNINTLQYRYYRGDRGKRLVRPIETQFRTENAKN